MIIDRVYFLTLQRRSKAVDSGKLNNSQKKQRKIQRKHNVSTSLLLLLLLLLFIIETASQAFSLLCLYITADARERENL